MFPITSRLYKGFLIYGTYFFLIISYGLLTTRRRGKGFLNSKL